jgi:hypothetical protein
MPAGNPNWVKGVSGNPGGRPKGLAEFREKLAGREEKILAVIDNALNGDDPRLAVEAAKLAMAYLYGRPTESTTQPTQPPAPPRLEEVRAMMQAQAGTA